MGVMLNVFRDTSVTAMNSLAHGRFRIVTPHAPGYPVHLVSRVVRNATGLLRQREL